MGIHKPPQTPSPWLLGPFDPEKYPQLRPKTPSETTNHPKHLHRGSSGHSTQKNTHNCAPKPPQRPQTTQNTFTVAPRAIRPRKIPTTAPQTPPETTNPPKPLHRGSSGHSTQKNTHNCAPKP